MDRSRKTIGHHSRAVIDALLPADGAAGSPPGALEAGFDDFYGDFERSADIRVRRAFRVALFVAVWVAPLLVRRRPPLSRLSPNDRERALDGLARSRLVPLRQVVVVLKAVVSLAYGADPRVRTAIGYR